VDGVAERLGSFGDDARKAAGRQAVESWPKIRPRTLIQRESVQRESVQRESVQRESVQHESVRRE
ncbi:hypothetical protein AB0M47_17205, partial [Hamadaea sp. NPDC051192]|uniref:hypothetical protein n=1 Tax=Hamadaea sp. NPDC051192 TaxID=3154940 RepID=UPI0034269791